MDCGGWKRKASNTLTARDRNNATAVLPLGALPSLKRNKMNSYELYIPPEIPVRNTINGRFTKGYIPHNKGKKWDDFMSKEAQQRASAGWVNLRKYRIRPENSGRAKRKVVAIDDDGRWIVFKHVRFAAYSLGGNSSNVSRCCRFNASRHVNKKTGKVNTDHKYMGYRLYFEDDINWLKKIK